MNVVFISPTFPPQYIHFCRALKQRGATVLGLGDSSCPADAQDAFHEFVSVPNLTDEDAAERAVGYLIWKHGKIHRIDSHNEHWLSLEAHLREAFNIPGPRVSQVAGWRSKSEMALLFQKAHVPHIVGERVQSRAQVFEFIRKNGFPVVLKPDTGVGAARTFKVCQNVELDEALSSGLEGYLIQPFVEGRVVTYDGLIDADGNILFETSHEYSAGVMEVIHERRHVAYWNVRDIPSRIKEYGRAALEVFGIRERFFHIEFIARTDGSLFGLEVNVRPPGGFTTDMMNYSADADVYAFWADMLMKRGAKAAPPALKYHVAHVGRRAGRRYAFSTKEVAELLGGRLLFHRTLPAVWATAMGEEAFVIRHEQLSQVQADIECIQKVLDS